ncbi:MAG: TIGR04086 family membrane protein [Clostridia bacterium]|nr:TIGR04086 family membrane protein [Clostridia bacterium]
MNKNISAKNEKEKNLFLCAAKGLLAAVICTLLLAVVCCFIGLSMGDPDKYTKIFALVSLFAGAFVGGFATAHEMGRATLFCGVLTGILLIAVMVLAALGFALPLDFGLFGLCAPCVLALAVLGANIGVGSGDKKKKKR